MARDLKLEVILQAVDRATRPIRAVTQSSSDLARQLKASRDSLKALQEQQRDVKSWRALRTASEQTEAALQAARDRVSALSKDLAGAGVPTRQMARDLKTAIREASALKEQHRQQQVQLQGLRNQLSAAGISTRDLSQHERELREQMGLTNRTIQDQEDRLKRLSALQRQRDTAKQAYARRQGQAGSMAAGGAAGLASGYALARPLSGMVNAFATAEDAATQLKVSMMGKNGQAGADFQRITDQATSLGDRLPGTTADFQDMMTMLRRQGLSTQSILGGTAESAAYLAVLLKQPATAAAEFAAKMQDATRTAEKDMMGLMDTIQRTHYLGVDSGNMLQGFTKLSPVMGIIKKSGLEAANELAPLLVMMDQTGMAGESAGNAIRKVFQSGMDAKRVGKANDALAEMKAGFSLDFTDGKGEFGGLDKLFAQLKKLKRLNGVQYTSVVKELFGDDSETLQVVTTLMDKGMAGYEEVIAKMQAQADLRQRVNEQLGTLTNITEAAQGSWSNAMAEIGATIAPQLKELIKALGDLAVDVKEWVKANPELTATLVKTAGGLAMLLTAGATLSLMLASLLGPIALVQYGLTLLGISGKRRAGILTSLAKNVLPLLVKGIRLVGGAVLFLGRALLMNPIGLAITALAGAAYLIYKNWAPIADFFAGLWEEIKAGFSSGIGGIAATLLNFSPLGLFYRAFAGVLNYFGVELPSRFSEFGNMIVRGLVDGLLAGMGQLKGAITQIGGAAIGWFKEKLGIHSPSRVFAELGGFTMEGLTQGLARGENGPLAQLAGTAKRLTQAGAIALGLTAGSVPTMANAEPLRVDNRPPLTAHRAPAVASAPLPPITINITSAPGMNEQQLAQLVAREIDRILRNQQARARSALTDQE